ncbi:MAG TPA: hypothetical protein DCK97_14060, partial [Tistrella mobilis]|nr:hypothetical protein [Tistrella mobilis]
MICLTSLAGSAVGRRRSLHAALLAAALLTTIPGLPAARAAETTVADAAGAGFDAARLTALGDRLAA